MYDRLCLGLSENEIKERINAGMPYTIRMLVPEGITTFKDMIHGKVVFNNNLIDDQVLMKSDGFPTYHFANIVDDYKMGISHVIRGVEWLPSTPKHVLLYKMFDLEPPTFAHIPLLIHKSGAKLSKRHGDMSVQSYKERGFLPESIINGLALLGWSPQGNEDSTGESQSLESSLESKTLSIKELESLFNLIKIGKSPCKFEETNFKHLNSQHIRKKFTHSTDKEKQIRVMDFRKILVDHLPEKLRSEIQKCSDDKICHIMDIMVPRIQFYSDLK